MSRRAVLALAVTVFLAALLGPVKAALSCSCADRDPRRALAEADGAFVGSLLRVRELAGARALYTFSVRQRVKGRIGPEVEVLSSSGGTSSCSLDAERGETVALLLERAGRRWSAGACDQLSPSELRTAAKPLAAPNGTGPAAFLVGGSFGAARLLSLDRRGRTLAYGRGKGETLALAPCPGGRRAVELFSTDGRSHLAVRELEGLRPVAEVALPRPLRGRNPTLNVTELACRDERADELVVFAADEGDEEVAGRGLLYRLRFGVADKLYDGRASRASLRGDVAYLASERGRILSVDVRIGTTGRVTSALPNVSEIVASPSGRRLALTTLSNERTSLSVVDVAGVRPARSVRLDNGSDAPVLPELAWLDDDRLAVVDSDAGRVTLVDESLRTLARSEGPFGSGVAALGSTLYFVQSGLISRLTFPGTRLARFRRLPGSVTYAFAALPQASVAASTAREGGRPAGACRARAYGRARTQ